MRNSISLLTWLLFVFFLLFGQLGLTPPSVVVAAMSLGSLMALSAFYPTVTIVVASYYVLFAAMSGSVETAVIESVVMTVFAAAAVAGFKWSEWIIVVALAGHGVFDAVHGHVIQNAGMPDWWPAWCLAYDVGAAAGLGWLLRYAPQPNEATA